MTTICEHRSAKIVNHRQPGNPNPVVMRCSTCNMELTQAQLNMAEVYRRRMARRRDAAERRSS